MRIEVKRIARALLAKPKREKLILGLRLKENAKADDREMNCAEIDALSDVYGRRILEDKVERTFQFVLERYAGATAAV